MLQSYEITREKPNLFELFRVPSQFGVSSPSLMAELRNNERKAKGTTSLCKIHAEKFGELK
jgi:hypothetical protein